MAVSTLAALRLDQRVVLAVRATLLLLGVVLTMAQRQMSEDLAALALLMLVAVAASVPLPAAWRPVSAFHPVIEAVLACGVMLLLEPLPETLLPYLLAPALAAGLAGGARVAVMTTGLGALVLLLGRAFGSEPLSWSSY